jgi:RimJ/RimL family protein N-acetyltransferase
VTEADGGYDARVLRTERTELVPLDPVTARAIAAGDRAGRSWADDFPGEGDLVVAGLAAETLDDPSVWDEPWDGDADPRLRPWRQPWLVRYQGRIVGTVGAKGPPVDGRVEIGYGLVRSVRGQGVATEAVGALLTALAEAPGAAGVGEVLAETLTDNHASRRVLAKLGFEQTGRHQSDEGELLSWRRLL